MATGLKYSRFSFAKYGNISVQAVADDSSSIDDLRPLRSGLRPVKSKKKKKKKKSRGGDRLDFSGLVAKISKKVDLNLNGFYKSGIIKYNGKEFNGKYIPYGYGIETGISLKI